MDLSSPPTTYLQFLDLTVDIALQLGAKVPVSSPHLSSSFMVEVEHLLRVVDRAQSKTYTLSWDSKTYNTAVGGQDGRNMTAEDQLFRQFPPLNTSICEPCVIQDAREQALVYYLPDALTKDRQSRIAESMETLKPALREGWSRTRGGGTSTAAWRNSEKLFLAAHQCNKFARGNISASPAWHAQGHLGFDAKLYVSSDLGPGPGKKASQGQRAFQSYVANNLETFTLASVALALTHPEQYATTRACLEKLSVLEHICDRVREWALAFNVLTVVANRESLLHRDKLSGGPDYLDQLLTIGGDDDTVLELPGIGVRFRYGSGTMALFSGHTHIHGVSRSTCERVCLASYARPSVHRRFNLHIPDAPTVASAKQYTYWRTYIQAMIDWASM